MPPPRDGELYGRLRSALASSWRTKARPEQLPPSGMSWAVWLILTGRGWGKTRTGAETVQEWIMTGAAKRLALVAATAADARDVMVEGPSGLLAIAPKHMRPEYEPSKRRLTWPNGAVATMFSADEPERLRGPEHDGAWCDELGAWRYPEAWDQLMFGLRIGSARTIVTTTPKPVRLIRELLAREGADVVVTRGRTMDNAANLSPHVLDALTKKYGGTRIGRQELDGVFLDDTPGAFWKRGELDALRVEDAPMLRRLVIAIDPAVTSGENADETGIMAMGIGRPAGADVDHGYLLEDRSGRYTPDEWGKIAIEMYRRHKADRVVAEVNNGGDLVESVLRASDMSVSYKAVHASRGKAVRAEPVSALYEQKRVHHVGFFEKLEDQMTCFTSDIDRRKLGFSPDRVDALVWGLSELLVDGASRRPLVIGDELLARSAMPGRFGSQPGGSVGFFHSRYGRL